MALEAVLETLNVFGGVTASLSQPKFGPPSAAPLRSSSGTLPEKFDRQWPCCSFDPGMLVKCLAVPRCAWLFRAIELHGPKMA
jgi:hypothetical protein